MARRTIEIEIATTQLPETTTITAMEHWNGKRYEWRWAKDLAWHGVTEEDVRGWAASQMTTLDAEVGNVLTLDGMCSALANWAWTLRRGGRALPDHESVVATCVRIITE